MTPSRKTQLKHLKAGRCQQCGKRPISKKSKVNCATCLKEMAAAAARARAAKIEAQRCPQCGLRADGEGQRCSKCSEIHAVRAQGIREQRRREGLCPECGAVPDKHTLCEDCLQRQRERRHRA